MVSKNDFQKIHDYLWEIPKSFREDMRVPTRIYASEKMFERIFKDRSVEQAINVATLPGILKYSLAMPDIHEGYGFPIGGVAAIRWEGGVISPGGIGYDINCLHPETKISLSFGTYLSIQEIEKDWEKRKFLLVNFRNKKIKDSFLLRFITREEKEKLFLIETELGRQIKVTGDHPLFVDLNDKKEAKDLKEGEEILIILSKG